MSTLVERLEELADVAESEVSETHPFTASLMATAMREAAAALERQGGPFVPCAWREHETQVQCRFAWNHKGPHSWESPTSPQGEG